MAVPEGVAGQAIPSPIQPVRYSMRSADAVALGGLGVLAVLPTIVGTALPYAKCAPCDSSSLWGIDRVAVGPLRRRVADISDGFLVLTTTGAGALVGLSRTGPGSAGWEDVAVLMEATEAAALITEWAKVLVARPRPMRYTAEAARYPEPEFGRSFPSGHATFSFAAAAAAASILQRRHELHRYRGQVVLLFSGAAVTSVLRVAAHRHFPTDIIAGAIIGTTVGWMVPRIHAAH